MDWRRSLSGLLIAAALSTSTAALCEQQPAGMDQSGFLLVQDHAGKMDHDGILSPGEIPNPNIDYDRAQRGREHHGDSRVDNPDNDREADRERYRKDRERDHEEWDHRRHHDHDDYDDDYRHDYDDDR